MIDLANSCHWHIIASLAWCVIYFTFAILLASGAAVNFRIEPQWAGLGEVVGIAPVILIGANVMVWRKIQLRRNKLGRNQVSE